MKRAYRLRRPEQFQRVRRHGRTVSTPLFTLTVSSGRRTRIRCGFIVGKQTGGAVVRNRAKRRLREAVRLLLPQIVSGYDLVFRVRSADVTTVPFSELHAIVAQVLRRAQVWHDASAHGAASV